MIYNFRIVSDEVNDFRREISIDADATFLQLRNAICNSVGYDKSQMNSFYICDDNWEKEQEVTLEDMGSDSDQEVFIMDETPIADLVEEEGQRMMFVYDYMTDRAFFMELKKIEPMKSLVDPVCTLARGKAPAQFVNLDHFEDDLDKKAAAAAAKTTAVEDFDYGEEFTNLGDLYNDEDLANLSDDTEIY